MKSSETKRDTTRTGQGQLARRLLSTLLLGLLGWPAATHAGEQPKKHTPATSAPPQLVWPSPPQRARLRYVGQVADLDVVRGKKKKKRGWMDRLAGVKQDTSSGAQLQKPYGIAVDSQGRIFVADGANRIVFVLDEARKEVGYRGNRAPAQLALPVGVTVDDHDRLFVSDSFFHQVTCFDPQGEVLAVLGTEELERPGGLAVDSRRKRLYVADAKAHRIAVFDTETFAFLRYIGEPSPRGERPEGTLAAPTNLAVDPQGLVYVTDTWNYRIQVFDPEGKFVRAFGEQGVRPGNFVRPKGIALDRDGHVYVADAEFNNIQVFTPEGRPLLAVGRYGTQPGQFVLIAGLFIDARNRLYTTEQWQPRVQIFEYIPETPAPGDAPSTEKGPVAEPEPAQIRR